MQLGTLTLKSDSHSNTHLVFLILAPSPVHNLHVMSLSLNSLRVTWQAGPGWSEEFWLLLMDQDGILLRNISLQNTSTSFLLDGLRPGTVYTVTMITKAVGLQSAASRQAATGEYNGILVVFTIGGRIGIREAFEEH